MASEALGMDICALDGVHSAEDDKEYIIECTVYFNNAITRAS